MVGFVWFVVGLSLSFSPPSDCISLPSMMTWASCPHGVRTRGKKILPHPLWLGPLPVCLAKYHQGKVRRLRLVLAALTHLTKAEIASRREGPHLPGGTVSHDLVYGYVVDASPEPEWLVITDGQQPGRWRLLHNSFGPGQSRKLPALSTNAMHR